MSNQKVAECEYCGQHSDSSPCPKCGALKKPQYDFSFGAIHTSPIVFTACSTDTEPFYTVPVSPPDKDKKK